MSDTAEAAAMEAAADVPSNDSPAPEGGQAVEGVTSEPTTEAPAEDLTLDLDQYGNYKVPIKVDGEEDVVPVSDLRDGYMRQSAFTKKTQELAQERERLRDAEQLLKSWNENPHGTLTALQASLGLQGIQAEPEPQLPEDPTERQLYQIQAQTEELAQWRANLEAKQHLDTTLASLSDKYGEDFDAQSVINQAAEQQRFDVRELELIHFEQIGRKAFEEAQRQASEADAADDASREAAKEAASVVESGGTAASAGHAVPQAMTLRQALEQAEKDLGQSL